MPHAVRTRRIYDPPAADDGLRILVDRLWPRGVSRVEARLDLWLRDIAPSTGLRQWFHGAAGEWVEFRRRYRAELDANPGAVGELRAALAKGPATLLFSVKDTERNHARLIVEYLARQSSSKASL
ncbi:MAG: DUF488 domain-containing protein [Alphaproteobacteria bacterium]